MTKPWIEEEIREQPAVLARFLEHAEHAVADATGGRDWRRVHLVGCGDMYFAAQAAAWLCDLHGPRPARSWRAMDLRWAAARLSCDDLVVCASISGRTPRTIEAASAARRAGARVVGVSDNERSPLAAVVDSLVLLRTSPPDALGTGSYPGYHHQVAQTKTFTAASLAQIVLATHARDRPALDGARIPAATTEAIASVEPAARAGAAEWFDGRDRVFVLGSGPHLPVARYGAAKLLEYAIAAEAQCIEEFNHLEAFVAGEKSLIVLLAPDPPSAQRARELLAAWEELGTRTVVIGHAESWPGSRTSHIPLPRAPLLESIFTESVALQWLAYLGAVARGRDPNAWLGGVRTELFDRTSRITVRGSAIVESEWRAEG